MTIWGTATLWRSGLCGAFVAAVHVSVKKVAHGTLDARNFDLLRPARGGIKLHVWWLGQLWRHWLSLARQHNVGTGSHAELVDCIASLPRRAGPLHHGNQLLGHPSCKAILASAWASFLRSTV